MVHPAPAGNILVAQIGRLEWALVWPVAALLALLGLGVWAFLRIKRWRQEIEEDLAPSRHDLLNRYQEMVEEGVLAPEEFARIRASLDPTLPETGIQAGPSEPRRVEPPETGIQPGNPDDRRIEPAD